jgi:hypothetical protein
MLLKAAGFYAHSGTPATSTTSRRGSQSPVDLGGQRMGSSLIEQIIDAVEVDGDWRAFPLSPGTAPSSRSSAAGRYAYRPD